MLANCESRPALDKCTSIYTISCSTLFLQSTTDAHYFPGHSLLFFIFMDFWLIFSFVSNLIWQSTTGVHFFRGHSLLTRNAYLTPSIEVKINNENEKFI